jgi:HEAT repeats
MRVCLACVISLIASSASPGAPGARPPAAHPGSGVIGGVVVNERHQPVARAQVQAFSARTMDPQPEHGGLVPFSTRASATATTDAAGAFRISGLPSGDYFVAAEPVPSITSGASTPTAIYATTFYPSTIDFRSADRVSALGDGYAPIQIQLVRVKGARVSGSVVSRSGRSPSGMDVRLFHRFGGFGSAATVATVSDKGTFEIAGVPPGWYRLTIAPRPTGSGGESASMLIEVGQSDLDELSLVLESGASVSGRVVAESSGSVPSAVGLRVTASPAPEQYTSGDTGMTATVMSDWSFHMTGPAGVYRFSAGADRTPFVKATRLRLDGLDAAADGVELTDGPHDVVVFVAPREETAPAADNTLSSAALVEQFKRETTFWRQFTIAQEIVNRADRSVLASLVSWLNQEDQHVRGNVAFIFGRFGDPRGFQVITEMLTDRSDRPEGQGIVSASSDGRYHVARQVAADRYYAAHLLGDLRDPRAVPVLVPLLADREVSSIVPWALGEIGDRRAIGPLIDALDDDSPSMRVLAIYALETLHAREAIPRLMTLLDDHRTSNFGAAVSVAEAAKAAIATLR